jgi:putative ABC transport system permease protein
VTRLAGWIYAAILRAYPAGFRERCGVPMLRTFDERCRAEAERGGLVALVRVCAGEYLDALAGIWRSRRPPPRREPAGAESWPAALGQDGFYACRRLVSQPALVAFTVLTLGFAIAANAALFSVVDAVLLRPSPFAEPARLFQLMNRSPRGMTYPGLSPTKLRHWRTETGIFDAVEVYRPAAAIVAGGVEPEEVPAAGMSPGLLAMLGIAPRLGRIFTAADAQEGQNHLVLVSERYWRTHLGGDEAAVGRTLAVNGAPHVIAGVMPERFHFPTLREELWIPIDPDAPPSSGARVANTIVRLREGLTAPGARVRIDAAAARLNADQPLPSGWGIVLDPSPLSGPDEGTRRGVLVLFGAVGLVLLTACANVANLLLSRAIDRHREFAIRRMLGASRARLVRELLVEGLLLGLLAGGAGLLAATWAIGTLVRLMPDDLLYATAQSIDVDARVVVFGLGLSLLTGILCNLPPAFRTFRHQGGAALSGRTRTATATPLQRRVRAALVTIEVGLAVVLLVGAALMVRSFMKLNAVDIGFNPDRLLAVTVGLDLSRYPTERARIALLQRVAHDVSDLSGVEGVAIASGLPPSPGSMSLAWLESERGPCTGEPEAVVSNQVTANYFTLLGIHVADGRPLRDDDPPEATVVSRSVARRCGMESLTGRRLRLGPNADWLTVVGTAADVKTRGIAATGGDLAVYLPFTAAPGALPNLAVMTERRLVARRLIVQAGPSATLVADIKRILWNHDPSQPVLSAAPAADLMADSIRRERFLLTLMSLFSAVSLALASAGIFGVLAYAVAQRSNEIGIRMALGASPADVLALVVGHGMRLVALGVAGGVAAAFAFSRVLAGLLFDVDPRDPMVFVAMPLLVLAMALLASWIPTARALRVDPASALRVE